ncbi:hypothetical protein P7C70_g4575, partial [Phenoliferia sp. Uapishka_3]
MIPPWNVPVAGGAASASGGGGGLGGGSAAKVERVRPKIFGFVVHEKARLQRWQEGVRDNRPVAASPRGGRLLASPSPLSTLISSPSGSDTSLSGTTSQVFPRQLRASPLATPPAMNGNDDRSKRPIRILSFDGDTFGGLSSLTIASRLANQLGTPSHPAKLCDWFDLIIGSGSGGVVALLLGRLEMDTNEATRKYAEISRTLFGPRAVKEISKGRKLEIEPLCAWIKGLCDGEPLLASDDSKCKVNFHNSEPSNTNTAAPVSTPFYPPDQQRQIFGRKQDVNRVFKLLAKLDLNGMKGHVAVVGVGGLGKTSLAREVMADTRAPEYGAPTFVACERLLTLPEFQRELLRFRAPHGIREGENLGDAVKSVLINERRLIILDNLLDNPFEAPNDYRQFVLSLNGIPNLTLIITTRNHQLTSNFNTTRRIHTLRLGGLSDNAADQLFRDEYDREDPSRHLTAPEPCLPDLLQLLSGIPLAIKLVAACARSQPSLQAVINLWKEGASAAWEIDGMDGREYSLEVSLSLSFKSLSSDTIDLLRLLSELPHPMYSRQLQLASPASPAIITPAINAALRCSIAQIRPDIIGRKELEILEPVRQYICRHWSLDVNGRVGRQLALGYFAQGTVFKLDQLRSGDQEHERELYLDGDKNFNAFLEITQGVEDEGVQQHRANAVLRFIDEEGTRADADVRLEVRRTLLGTLLVRCINCSSEGHFQLVKVLHEAGAPVDVENEYGNTPFLTAAKNGHLSTAKGLLDLGAFIEAQNGDGNAALHLAALQGDFRLAKLLLESGASAGTKNKFSATPLHLTMLDHRSDTAEQIKGRVDVAHLLVASGAPLAAQDGIGKTPLHKATHAHSLERVRLLLNAGASVDSKDANGSTPLHLIGGNLDTYGNVLDVTEILVRFGAPLDWKDNNGETPLHAAVASCPPEVVKALLTAGSASVVNTKNSRGQTPLRIAVKKNEPYYFDPLRWRPSIWDAELETARLLIDFGAAPDVKDDAGITPLRLAAGKGDWELVDLITEALEARGLYEDLLESAL